MKRHTLVVLEFKNMKWNICDLELTFNVYLKKEILEAYFYQYIFKNTSVDTMFVGCEIKRVQNLLKIFQYNNTEKNSCRFCTCIVVFIYT